MTVCCLRVRGAGTLATSRDARGRKTYGPIHFSRVSFVCLFVCSKPGWHVASVVTCSDVAAPHRLLPRAELGPPGLSLNAAIRGWFEPRGSVLELSQGFLLRVPPHAYGRLKPEACRRHDTKPTILNAPRLLSFGNHAISTLACLLNPACPSRGESRHGGSPSSSAPLTNAASSNRSGG